MLANKKETSLYLHEWLVVAVFISSLLILALYSYWRATPNNEESNFKNGAMESYVITITGAVRQPGQYHVKKGTTVSEAIQLAGPSENADFKKIILDKPVKPRARIQIPQLIPRVKKKA